MVEAATRSRRGRRNRRVLGRGRRRRHGPVAGGVARPRRSDGRRTSLYRWDGIHPNRVGTYLAALVVYAGLRGVAPVAPNSLVVEGNPFWIPRDTARMLRDSAREALSMRFSTPACSQL